MDAYERGNYATALSEWRPLAEKGDAHAQLYLGVLYHQGRGIPQDYAKARKWYEKAAARGYAQAQSNLAALYANGNGVPKNYVRAYMWWSLAAGHSTGNVQKDPANNRDDVARRMTPAEIAEAQKLAREWAPKTP
jgi:TPR repeat protein